MDFCALIAAAVGQRASDVHINPGRPPTFRIDGRMLPQTGCGVLSADDTEALFGGLLGSEQRARLTGQWELDLSYEVEVGGTVTRLRINLHRQLGGLGGVCRLIPKDIPDACAITLEASIQHLVNLPRGLVLLTGPTGSGKSTTLACLIEAINRRDAKHILTIEDPIEYVYAAKRCDITQRELGSHTQGFAPALKSALRADPDVILIGEMRDLETISLALTASETGHLVFSTLHTTDASQTVDRVIDVFPPAQQRMVRTQLSSVLQAVVTQVLLPRANGPGRVAAREILLANAAVRTLIREENTHQIYSAMSAAIAQGMCPLELSLAAKVRTGLVREVDAVGAANRLPVLRNYLEARQLPLDAPGLRCPSTAFDD